MSEQHTPGPWTWPEGCTEIEALADPENSRTYYAPVAHMDLEWSGETMAANARLIAAAPELLEALKAIVGKAYEYANRPDITDDIACGFYDIIEDAQDAIAKAKGE